MWSCQNNLYGWGNNISNTCMLNSWCLFTLKKAELGLYKTPKLIFEIAVFHTQVWTTTISFWVIQAARSLERTLAHFEGNFNLQTLKIENPSPNFQNRKILMCNQEKTCHVKLCLRERTTSPQVDCAKTRKNSNYPPNTDTDILRAI